MDKFAEFFRREIRTKPYLPSFRGGWVALAGESLLCKAIFLLLVFPFFIPLLYAFDLMAWHLPFSQFDLPVFLKTISAQSVIAAAFILYAVLAIREKKYAPFFTRTHLFLLGMGIILLITALISLDPRASIFSGAFRADGLILLFHSGLYIGLLSWVVRGKARFELLSLFAIVGGALTCALVLLLYFIPPAAFSGLTLRQFTQVILGNTGFFAHYLLLVSLLNGYFLLTKPRIWNIAAAGVLFFGIIAALSTTAMGIMGVLYAVLLWFVSRRLAYGLILFSLGAWWYEVTIGDPYLALIFSPATEEFVRGQIWMDALSAVWAHRPWLGFGWGNAEIMWNFLVHDSWAASGTPWSPIFFDKTHNVLVEFFVAAGILGLAAVVLFWARIFWTALHRARTGGTANRRIWIFFIAAFTAHLGYIFFNFDSLMSYIFISVLIAAYIVLSGEPRREITFQKKFPRFAAMTAGLVIGAISLAYLNVKPAYAYARRQQVETRVRRPPQSAEDEVEALLTRLARTRDRYPPYDLLLIDHGNTLQMLVNELAGDSALRTPAIAEMRSVYDELIAAHPVNSFYLYQRAKAEHNIATDVGLAEAYLDKAIALSPSKGIFRFQLGIVYLKADKLNEARGIFLQLKQDGWYPGAMDLYLAIADFLDGKLMAGKKKFLSALTTYTPEVAVEWNMLAGAYLVHGKPVDLLVWFQRISRLVGPNKHLNEIMLILEDMAKESQPSG